MLTLSKDTWHYRNFRAWQLYTNSKRHPDLLPRYEWAVGESYDRVELPSIRQPDLCTYTRIAFIYGPARRLGHWIGSNDKRLSIAIVLGIYSFFAAILSAVKLLGGEEVPEWWQVFAYPALAMVGGAILLLFVFLVFASLDLAKEKYTEYKWNKVETEEQKPEPEPNVIIEFVKAKKRKICPFIEFAE